MTITTKKCCYTALMIAITFIMIYIIKIPIPNGYIHLGDGAVFLCGYILGPILGTFAACVGAASADYFSGYAIYIIPTILAKGTMAWLTAWAITQPNLKNGTQMAVLFGASIVMALIYYLSEVMMYGNELSPLVNIPFNLLQAAVGLVISVLLFKPLLHFRLVEINPISTTE
ncbi:ECF transporter S component [Eubacterium aggregans]|uniref:ECF transporter S component n=1 Tax=Eubacterium aggregans TaxID=81409 RepID=UPI003F40CA0D